MTEGQIDALVRKYVLPKIEDRGETRGQAWNLHDMLQMTALVTVKADRLKWNAAMHTLSERHIYEEIPDIIAYGLKLLAYLDAQKTRPRLP